jgi:hypothetical protein
MTVRELVEALGGPAAVGRSFGISTEAVCQWTAANAVPRARRLDVWALAQRAGLAWRPPGGEGLTLRAATYDQHAGRPLTADEQPAEPSQAAA